MKRNHDKAYFEFEERELQQLEKLGKFWRSAYYLMVGETVHPPLYCFLTIDEVDYLLMNEHAQVKLPFRIMNKSVRMYCRGSENFYGLFYRCFRGSSIMPNDYYAKISNYLSETKRVIVELSTQRGKEETGHKNPKDLRLMGN